VDATGVTVAIVADDLTGAMDSAAPFAACGLETRIMLQRHAFDDLINTRPRVIAVTTESRHLAPRGATDAVKQAIAALAKCQPWLLFKKIDSTLRGNVAQEVIAALAASGRRHALIAPAVPSQGRVMHGGEMYVHGTPLSKTAFGKDALFNARYRPLAHILRELEAGITVHEVAANVVPVLSDARGLHCYICDCSIESDLDLIARLGVAKAEHVLMVGAAGIAEALARILGTAVIGSVSERIPQGTVLFVVGSRTQESVGQATAIEERGAVAFTLPVTGGQLEIANRLEFFGSGGRVPETMVLRVEPVANGDAEQIARGLGEVVARLASHISLAALVLIGGDTAQAVLRALGVCTINVAGLLTSGIAVGDVEYAGRKLAVVTKAGGFGDVDVFTSIVRKLKGT
jgi:D-threonate/D-erythronate kinase